MVQLLRNEESGKYGLQQCQLQDGTYSYHFPLEDAVKPEEINEHGTKR